MNLTPEQLAIITAQAEEDDRQSAMYRAERRRNRGPQPRCPTCGRFAYWNDHFSQWKLGCINFNVAEGVVEHD